MKQGNVNISEVAIEWLYGHSKKMISLIERYQKATTSEKKDFLRKKIEEEIYLEHNLLKVEQPKNNGIYDADGEQAKRFDLPIKKNSKAPIDIECE